MKKKEYIEANKNWLKAKACQEGVMPLGKGVFYKVLTAGKNNGIHPLPRSIVTVDYTGRTTDGKTFDSTAGSNPLAIRVCDVIDGWATALVKMCVGDKWEVYIPAEQGYSRLSQPGIPGGSTLVFEIQLLNIM